MSAETEIIEHRLDHVAAQQVHVELQIELQVRILDDLKWRRRDAQMRRSEELRESSNVDRSVIGRAVHGRRSSHAAQEVKELGFEVMARLRRLVEYKLELRELKAREQELHRQLIAVAECEAFQDPELEEESAR